MLSTFLAAIIVVKYINIKISINVKININFIKIIDFIKKLGELFNMFKNLLEWCKSFYGGII